MADTERHVDRTADPREPWNKPKLIPTTSARESESGILTGPEFLIKLS